MALSLHLDPIYAGLFGDDALTDALGPHAEVAAMVRVEATLAKVQADLGVIPQSDGAKLAEALNELSVEPAALAKGVVSAGVAIPALVASLRDAVGPELCNWVHWGATSQDIIDNAHLLQYRAALTVIQERLAGLIDALKRQSETHAKLLMAARTRSQIATPITFGLRTAQWAAPLIDAENALKGIKTQLLRIQFGGASGANSAVAPHGKAISDGLAKEFRFEPSPPWHTNRSGIYALTGWLGSLCVGLSKFAGDLMLMGRSESGEAQAGTGGGSSTMPQKANPVTAEAIQTLCHLAQTAQGGLSRPHVEERDGVAWTLEWTLVPQMLHATGTALRHAHELAETLRPNPANMAKVIEQTPGIWAEAASFTLAQHMPRGEAVEIVKQALAHDAGFVQGLSALSPHPIDWDKALAPDETLESCDAIAKQIFAGRKNSAA